MANFKSKDVLTVSATIIAGLLILLTTQAIYTNPVVTKINQIQNDLDGKTIELGSDIQTMSYLKSALSQANDTQSRIHIQNQIDDLQMQSWQTQAQINGLKSQQSQWDSFAKQYNVIQNLLNLRYAILVMVIPFCFTIMIEISAVSRRANNPLDETASRFGKEALFWSTIILVTALFFSVMTWTL